MRVNPEALARASSRHPWRVVATWALIAIASFVAAGLYIGDVLNDDIEFTNRPESVRAQELIDAKFGDGTEGKSTEYVIVSSDSTTVDDRAFRAYVERLQGALASAESVATPPTTYYQAAAQSPEAAAGLVSKDQRATLIPVVIKDQDEDTIEGLRGILAAEGDDAFTTQLAGQATLFVDFATIAQEDAQKGESIGFIAALLVLVVVFGSILAAVVPLVMAIAAIGVALGLVTLLGQFVGFNLFVENMILMIGMAVGIDYSLFIVSRYREERKKGYPKLDAIAASGATASRAVFFSGVTVVLALMGMLILPTTIFRSLAAGAIFVTLLSLLAALTLLPAVLSLLGDRINWPRLSRRARLDVPHDVPGGFWDRLTRRVMARPVLFLVAAVVVLGTLGSFTLQLNKGSSTSIDTFPDDVPSKAAFLTLQQEFAGGLTEPAEIVVSGDVDRPEVQAAVEELRQRVSQMPAFAPETQVVPSEDGSVIRVSAFFAGTATQNEEAFAAIRELREDFVPAVFGGIDGVEVLVGGNTAFFSDFLDVTDTYQWIVLAFVLGLSFILLMVVFRSIVVPIKAILMNLLSVAAAYGAITLVFQKGFGIGFFNAIGFSFQKTEAIEAWLPLFLFSVLFGLSMDYHVFLLSRIREEYDKTHDNAEAVAYGLRTTAGIITGAAIIMVVVFIGFASGRLGPFQQMGFGLAVAVFMDATIVRTLLVPASMRLLGDLNWYLPSWLQWLPKLNVEGHEPERVTVPDTPAELVDAGRESGKRPGEFG